jgi:NADPH-dependent ferric siderophore reductase
MASFQRRLRDTVGRWFGKELKVDEVRDLTPHVRRIRASGAWLRGARVSPGDKLQIMILECGPRTYTPFAHDTHAGTLELLAYVHGDTKTAAWVRGLAPGATFHAVGPRGSLALAELEGAVVLFGDETSFATAVALQSARGANDGLSFVFECGQVDEARTLLDALGVSNHSVVVRRSGRSHLPALERELRAALAKHAGAKLVLTGHAQTIQALRAALKARPPAYAGQTVKAYWADGKRGLD